MSFGRSASNVSVPVIVAAIVIALVGAAPAGGQSDEGPAPAEATPDEAAPGQEQVPVEEQQPAGDQADDEEPLPPEIEKYTAGTKEVLDEDAVFKQFERKRRIRDVLLRPFVFDAIDESWQRFNDELDDRTGLRLSFAYTLLGQWTPDSDRGQQGIAGDLDLTGVWNVLRAEEAGGSGYLGFATEWRHELGPRPASALASQFDAFSRTTQAFNEQDFALVQIWWAQDLLDETLTVTAGKVSPRSFYNTNRLRNQNTTFLNQVFAGNRAMGFPARGIGVNAAYRPADTWYVTGGVHDANGSATAGNFGSVDEGQFAYVGEYGWTPTFAGLGRGNYRFTLWYSDASQERNTGVGKGFALSFDQDLGPGLIAFMRYAWADGDARGAEQTLSGGVGLVDPFGREDDMLGLGLGWSEPDRPTENEEIVAEAFYRLQLSRVQQVSLGWQAYITPAFDPDDDVVNVFSVRWRVQF
ncbi:MAG: carbohydrate porin [Planctomycetota bacterium]